MVSDKEMYEQKSICDMFLAIQRKKDNNNANKRIFRKIIYDFHSDLESLKVKCKSYGGIWRIYKTVNKRDMRKALHNFRHTIIDTDKTSIESLWRKELLQPDNKFSKFFMIDLDNINLLPAIEQWLSNNKIDVRGLYKSPNGWHIVTDKFNRKEFNMKFPKVDILTDGYFYIDTV